MKDKLDKLSEMALNYLKEKYEELNETNQLYKGYYNMVMDPDYENIPGVIKGQVNDFHAERLQKLKGRNNDYKDTKDYARNEADYKELKDIEAGFDTHGKTHRNVPHVPFNTDKSFDGGVETKLPQYVSDWKLDLKNWSSEGNGVSGPKSTESVSPVKNNPEMTSHEYGETSKTAIGEESQEILGKLDKVLDVKGFTAARRFLESLSEEEIEMSNIVAETSAEQLDEFFMHRRAEPASYEEIFKSDKRAGKKEAMGYHEDGDKASYKKDLNDEPAGNPKGERQTMGRDDLKKHLDVLFKLRSQNKLNFDELKRKGHYYAEQMDPLAKTSAEQTSKSMSNHKAMATSRSRNTGSVSRGASTGSNKGMSQGTTGSTGSGSTSGSTGSVK